MVYPDEQPVGHPIQERWAQDRRCIFAEQDELERRWLQADLLAIGDVAHKMAQEVHVQDAILILARICPGDEHKVFLS